MKNIESKIKGSWGGARIGNGPKNLSGGKGISPALQFRVTPDQKKAFAMLGADAVREFLQKKYENIKSYEEHNQMMLELEVGPLFED